jgi:hypothetical protein
VFSPGPCLSPLPRRFAETRGVVVVECLGLRLSFNLGDFTTSFLGRCTLIPVVDREGGVLPLEGSRGNNSPPLRVRVQGEVSASPCLPLTFRQLAYILLSDGRR